MKWTFYYIGYVFIVVHAYYYDSYSNPNRPNWPYHGGRPNQHGRYPPYYDHPRYPYRPYHPYYYPYPNASSLFFYPNASFSWSQDTQYDYIVGISLFDRPICPGIIVTMHTILTSANPLERFWPVYRYIKIHTVHENFDTFLTRNISKIFVDQAFRERVWVGSDRFHSSIHDIILLKMEEPIYTLYRKTRGPIYATLPYVESIYNASLPYSGWMVAGFGYTDKEHTRNNSILEVTNLSGSIVDCNEYLPRGWGLFICISDDDGLHAVPSGGPLFHEDDRNVVYGIGCFHLKRGNDSILIFTNLKAYRFGLVGYYANDPETTSSTLTYTFETTTESENRMDTSTRMPYPQIPDFFTDKRENWY